MRSRVTVVARLRLRTALGSLYESQAALRLAAAWGYVGEADAERSFKELEVFGGGRLYGLIRRWWLVAAEARAVSAAPELLRPLGRRAIE